jgi:hypothetical protein
MWVAPWLWRCRGCGGSLLALTIAALVMVVFALLSFIILRRMWRARVLRRTDELRRDWNALLESLMEGTLPRSPRLWSRIGREVIERILVDRLRVATPSDGPKLLAAIRRCGILDYHIEKLRSGSAWQRVYAASLLGRIGDEIAVPPLCDALIHDRAPAVRTASLKALAVIGSELAVPAVISAASSPPNEPILWLEAAVACVRKPSAFRSVIADGRPDLRALAVRAMAALNAVPDLQLLDGLVFDRDPDVRAQVARALGRCASAAALPLLSTLACDEVWFVRLRAVAAIGELRDVGGLDTLLRCVRDEDQRVRAKAAASLALLGKDSRAVLSELAFGANSGAATRAYIAELSGAGILWDAIESLDSDSPDYSEKLLEQTLQLGFRRELLYALSAHPRSRVRGKIGRLFARNMDSDLRRELTLAAGAAPSAAGRRFARAVLATAGESAPLTGARTEAAVVSRR